MSCLKCGYDLRGNESGVCPECGAAFTPLAAWISSERNSFIATSWRTIGFRFAVFSAVAAGVFAWYLLAVPNAETRAVLTASGWVLVTTLPAVILARCGSRDMPRLLGLLWLRGMPLLHAGWLATWLIMAASWWLVGVWGSRSVNPSASSDVRDFIQVASLIAMVLALAGSMAFWAWATSVWSRTLRFERAGVQDRGFSVYLILGVLVLVGSTGCCLLGLLPNVPTV